MKLEIKLLDETGFIIDANIWNQYTLYPIKLGDILIIKNIQVKKDNEGINYLTTVDETDILINQEIKKENKLKEIYKKYMEEMESNKNIKYDKKINTKNKLENKNGNCILKYININNGNFMFIKELINSNKNKNKFTSMKMFYGYINKIIYSKYDDLIIYTCLTCAKILKQKGSFWFCSNCKKNLIYPNYTFKDLLINIIDASWNINVCLSSKKIKGIFGVSADKIKNIEDIKIFEDKIKFKLCCVYTLNNYDKNGYLIPDEFNLVINNKMKDINLSEIKKYFKL